MHPLYKSISLGIFFSNEKYNGPVTWQKVRFLLRSFIFLNLLLPWKAKIKGDRVTHYDKTFDNNQSLRKKAAFNAAF